MGKSTRNNLAGGPGCVMQAADSAVIYGADHNMSAGKKHRGAPVADINNVSTQRKERTGDTKRLQQFVWQQLYLSGRQLVAGGNNF